MYEEEFSEEDIHGFESIQAVMDGTSALSARRMIEIRREEKMLKDRISDYDYYEKDL